MIGVDGEGHQLLERHAVLGVDVEQVRRDRGQAQSLLHDVRRRRRRPPRCPPRIGPSRAGSGTRGTGRADGARRAERSRRASPLRRDVSAGVAHDARHRRGLGEALLLHQQLKRPIAPAAGWDLEHAGFVALGVKDRPDVEALQQGTPGDVLGQILDRDAGLHPPDVGLAQDELVEGDVARRRQGDLLNGICHVMFSATGGREPLSRPPTRHENRAALFLSWPRRVERPESR